MYYRLLNYLNINYIIADNQCGFREGHSTNIALLRMINDITYELDNNSFSVEIFIDLSKTFNTVDHSLLINIHHYGVRGNALQWCSNYIEDRT